MSDGALNSDIYQVAMAIAEEEYDPTIADAVSSFDLFVRRLPEQRNYLVACGLEEAIKYLQNLRFDDEDIAYLSSLPQFAGKKEFLERLRSFKFTGDIWAVKEGTPVFGNEPILRVTGLSFASQYVETHLINIISSSTMFASKAARIVDAAGLAQVMEFGSRRSQDPAASSGRIPRAAYLSGFIGTSNMEAGRKYGIPVIGTMAHSYVQKFVARASAGVDGELEAFRAFAKSFPDHTVLLVDTYNTEEGIRKAIIVGKELEERGHRLVGIRIDSGDLAKMSRIARNMLEESGLGYVKIVLSNDLDEYKINELKENGARFDMLGVGTMQATSNDAPSLGAVYKLAEQEVPGGLMVQTMKASEGKATLPGLKQVYRFNSPKSGQAYMDEICLAEEERTSGTPLLEKVMEKGELKVRLPTLEEIRKYATEQRSRLSLGVRGIAPNSDYDVQISPRLDKLQQELMAAMRKPVKQNTVKE